MLRSLRLLHTTRVLRDEIPIVITKLGKGKKKAPIRQNLVILDGHQSKLYNNRNRERKPKQIPNLLDLTQIQERTSRLLDVSEVSPSASLQELCDTINSHRPVKSDISEQRYLQVTGDLWSEFSTDQIKKYMSSEYPRTPQSSKISKRRLVNIIVQTCWGCNVSMDINPQDDLIQTKSFHLSKKEMFLLVNHSSIIQNWVRANVRIVLYPVSLLLTVSANEGHLQYIDLALSSLFKNRIEKYVDLGEVEELSQVTGESLPLEDIQMLTGVFFEKDHDSDHVYKMSSLGDKKFSQAKRMILWSLDYNPFTKMNVHIDNDSECVKFFKTRPDQSLPWIHRKKTWYRLKQPNILGLPLPEIKIDGSKIFKDLNGAPHTVLSQIKDKQAVTAVAFGQILHSSNDKSIQGKTIMNTDVPFIHEKVMKLPLYQTEGSDIDMTVDNHTYYVQIKFLPSPYNETGNYMKYPPLEFWFDLDENECVAKDSLQVLCITNDQNSMVSIPQAVSDLKFVKSEMVDLADTFVSESEWLQGQTGIKEFLKAAKLQFSGQQQISVPEYVEVNLPGVDEPVRYDHVTMCHRKQLDLEYMGRLVTYAVIEGGSLGGSTSEVIMVGKEDELDQDNFQHLVDDAVKFVKELGV